MIEFIAALVIGIYDGDTITILDELNNQHRIRLASIDAPEAAQPYGQKSKAILAAMVFQKQVDLSCPNRDRYQRYVCTVYLKGQDVNYQIVAEGGAWVYRKYYHGKTYYAAENHARDNALGLWSTSEAQAIPPWEWRHQQ